VCSVRAFTVATPVFETEAFLSVVHCPAASNSRLLRWVAFIQWRLLAVTGMGMLRSLSQAEGSVRALRA
jgi:hypothetical protein